MNNSNLLYIVSEGRLNGYVHKAYASSYDNLNAVLSDTVYVNKTTQLAVVTLPNNSNPSEWLLVDSNWDVDKIATEDGWRPDDRKIDLKPKSYDVPAWAAKAALDEAGLLDAVNNIINQSKADLNTDNVLYYKWHSATSFNSGDPDLVLFAKNNGLEDKLKDLFDKALDISNKRGAYAKT